MLYLPVIALVAALVHIFIDTKRRTPQRILETILLYELVIATGIGSIMGFLGHTMKAAEIARFIGWRAGSPFQFEVAVADLSYGILGILCFWLRGNFWTATIISTSVFGLGAAWGHVQEILVRHNMAPGNAGAPLYLDIIMPIVMICLLTALKLVEKKKKR